MSRTSLKFILPVATGAVALALWTGVHFLLDPERRFMLPTPLAVLLALRDNAAYLAAAAVNTSLGALLGFALAVVVSFSASLVLSLSPLVRTSLYPYLMALQLTPIPILAPIAIIWTSAGLQSVTLLTFAMAFFPLIVNTTQGLISVDRNQVELFRLYRASRLQELFFLRVPAALPFFFTGLRIAATLAPIAAVVADMNAGTSAGGSAGLGFAAIIFSTQAKYPALFATAAVTCILGFVFNAAILGIARLALQHWHDSYERTDK